MSISLFSKNNERLMRGLNYDSFTSLAISANDRFRKGGPISDRTIRLTKDGKGIATTTFRGTTGARVGQIADARRGARVRRRAGHRRLRLKFAECGRGDGRAAVAGRRERRLKVRGDGADAQDPQPAGVRRLLQDPQALDSL